ncbi:MAG: IclR family transcriptional regulator, partial [Sulfobacillus sp.]|nr:IclR family transcriptional regulator [Sulfobacillus sp.]
FWGSFSGALCLASDKALPYRPGHWVTFPDSDHERAISGPWLGDEYPGIVAMPAAGMHDAAHARYLIERAMTDFVSDSGTEDSRTARLQDMVSLNPDEATREEVL